jgi:type IV secretion system protein VirB10
MGKLTWPLSLVLAGVLIYGALTPDAAHEAKAEDLAPVPAPELMRPAPRAVPAAPDPVFVPTSVAAPGMGAGNAAMPPQGYPGEVPTTSPPAASEDEADKVSPEVELAQLRRRAPLMITLEGGGAAPIASKDPGAGVVQEVAPPASRDVMLATATPAALPKVQENEPGSARIVLESAEALEQQILQGKTIPAVLETPIHTDLPGSVRAMVDEDVYGESGRLVVIPRMSRLVGEYRRDVRHSQSRVLVVWQRAILPDGRSLLLMSPGTDGLGRAGMSGEVDNHFLERFGAAFLVSMIGVAAENAARQSISTGNGGLVIWGTQSHSKAMEGLNSTVESMLKSQADMPPTIQIVQGSRVRVFVARDLDLSKATKPETR